MSVYSLLAEAFCYPRPGLLDRLETGLTSIEDSPVQSGLASFINKVKLLSLSEWEELSTNTLDLSPTIAPYVGYQIWGESYKRGEFMANLSRQMMEQEIDTEGELPDHLVPILRYLDAADDPLPELMENLGPAVQKMMTILKQKDRDNPYIDLMEAVLEIAQGLTVKA